MSKQYYYTCKADVEKAIKKRMLEILEEQEKTANKKKYKKAD